MTSDNRLAQNAEYAPGDYRRRLPDLRCQECHFTSTYLYDAANHERVKGHKVTGWATQINSSGVQS